MDKEYDSDPSNYSYIWFAIHVFAVSVHLIKEKRCFKKFMVTISDKLPCKKCRRHLKQFMEEIPIENYYRRKNGCFRWSWELHNKVNEYLGKPIVKYKDALEYYDRIDLHECQAPECL